MAAVTAQEVLDLVVARVREVMALDSDQRVLARAGTTSWREVRFDEDLHTDSLDLVEIVEGVERELRRRGLQVNVADADLARLRLVGDVVDVLVGAQP